MRLPVRRSAILAAVLAVALPASARAADDEGVRHFEQKIRPVLVKHCYACHSAQARDAKKLKGGLSLDTATGVLAGGESGPVIVKGKSRDSLLMKSLRHDGPEMPPSGKLPADVIADFAKWIDAGAPDPRSGETAVRPRREISVEEGRQWWAFRPLQPVAAPAGRNPIDGFVRQAQLAKGIKPNSPASRETLIRRAYFDLIGLPPTEAQIDAFVNDKSPTAFEKVVDSLLASPAYGERWARHWLDAARYAESGGYEFDGFRPGAYHYRDWVIRSLNADLPYDRFLRMQLAGDLIQPDAIEGAAATGFLVAGPYPGQITSKTVERIRYDQLDDMLMTVGGSMLGLTLGCVRCHDHKYDPIPQQDYYALAAALARTSHGPRTMDLDHVATERAVEKHRTDGAALAAALRTFATKDLPPRFEAWRKTDLAKLPEPVRWNWLEPVALDAERSYLKELPGGVIAHDGVAGPIRADRPRGSRPAAGAEEHYRLTFHTHQPTLTALRLDAFTDKALPQRGPGLNPDGSFQLADLTVTAKPLDPLAKDAARPAKLKAAFAAFEDKDQPLAHAVDAYPATAWVVKATAKADNAAVFAFDPPLAGFPNGTVLVVELKFRDLGIGRLRVAASAEPGPATWAGAVAPQHAAELRALAGAKQVPDTMRESLARWFAPFDAETAKVVRAVRDHAAAAPRPKLSEVYTTVAGGQDVFFLRRGEVENKAGKAAPGIVQVLSRGAVGQPKVDPRVALADWMTDADRGAGPLAARVMANRVWQHHFGRGIVGTPNDFGAQGERPTHPELLEYLAGELVRGGWKLKPLHRLVMLSDTYQQSHEVDPANVKLDPDNRLLWHTRPRRLEAETIRDALLAVGGNLDPAMFGPSVLDAMPRRSIYLRVKRSELLPIMTMFDSPEPTQSIGERSVTTVPTQALAMMNSPFVRWQAELLAARIAPADGAPIAGAIDRGYRIAFGRPPTTTERDRMVAFVDRQRTATGATPAATRAALVEFCHALLCLNEFVYID